MNVEWEAPCRLRTWLWVARLWLLKRGAHWDTLKLLTHEFRSSRDITPHNITRSLRYSTHFSRMKTWDLQGVGKGYLKLQEQ